MKLLVDNKNITAYNESVLSHMILNVTYVNYFAHS